jgi:hypothetical protein
MLIPRFTLRGYLWLTVAVAALGTVGSFALRGHRWAVAVLAALGLVPFLFLVFALLFALAWVFVEGALARARAKQQPGSPFATDRPAEQLLPPVR